MGAGRVVGDRAELVLPWWGFAVLVGTGVVCFPIKPSEKQGPWVPSMVGDERMTNDIRTSDGNDSQPEREAFLGTLKSLKLWLRPALTVLEMGPHS